MHAISSAGNTVAVDFGNSTTKIAIKTGQTMPCVVPVLGLSRDIPCSINPPAGIPVIPSLIRYSPDGRVFTGQEAFEPGSSGGNGLIRWMVHYISVGNPARVHTGDTVISYQEAGEVFLQSVLAGVCEQYHMTRPGLVMTVPVCSYDHFHEWVLGFTARKGYSRIHLIDEPTAAALSCCPDISAGEPFLFFDFGGDSLEVSVAALGNEGAANRCRLLGYAIEQIGGTQIDQWLCSEIVRRAGFREAPSDLLKILLPECERAKESLSVADEAAVEIPGKDPVPVTRGDLEGILAANAFYSRINAVIERALAGAFSRGYTESDISAVIAAGGGSAIPSVRDLLSQRFGEERISTHSGVDAVVLGAALAGKRYPDDIRVRNEYALKVWDARSAGYTLRTIVRKGSFFPSERPVARFRIQGTYDGQTQMGIAVYELPFGGNTGDERRQGELVVRPSGLVCYHDNPAAIQKDREAVWVNEKNPTFIPAYPPALQGEPRFEVWFMIDSTRGLRVSARDLRTGQMAVENVLITKLY